MLLTLQPPTQYPITSSSNSDVSSSGCCFSNSMSKSSSSCSVNDTDNTLSVANEEDDEKKMTKTVLLYNFEWEGYLGSISRVQKERKAPLDPPAPIRLPSRNNIGADSSDDKSDVRGSIQRTESLDPPTDGKGDDVEGDKRDTSDTEEDHDHDVIDSQRSAPLSLLDPPVDDENNDENHGVADRLDPVDDRKNKMLLDPSPSAHGQHHDEISNSAEDIKKNKCLLDPTVKEDHSSVKSSLDPAADSEIGDTYHHSNKHVSDGKSLLDPTCDDYERRNGSKLKLDPAAVDDNRQQDEHDAHGNERENTNKALLDPSMENSESNNKPQLDPAAVDDGHEHIDRFHDENRQIGSNFITISSSQPSLLDPTKNNSHKSLLDPAVDDGPTRNGSHNDKSNNSNSDNVNASNDGIDNTFDHYEDTNTIIIEIQDLSSGKTWKKVVQEDKDFDGFILKEISQIISTIQNAIASDSSSYCSSISIRQSRDNSSNAKTDMASVMTLSFSSFYSMNFLLDEVVDAVKIAVTRGEEPEKKEKDSAQEQVDAENDETTKQQGKQHQQNDNNSHSVNVSKPNILMANDSFVNRQKEESDIVVVDIPTPATTATTFNHNKNQSEDLQKRDHLETKGTEDAVHDVFDRIVTESTNNLKDETITGCQQLDPEEDKKELVRLADDSTPDKVKSLALASTKSLEEEPNSHQLDPEEDVQEKDQSQQKEPDYVVDDTAIEGKCAGNEKLEEKSTTGQQLDPEEEVKAKSQLEQKEPEHLGDDLAVEEDSFVAATTKKLEEEPPTGCQQLDPEEELHEQNHSERKETEHHVDCSTTGAGSCAATRTEKLETEPSANCQQLDPEAVVVVDMLTFKLDSFIIETREKEMKQDEIISQLRYELNQLKRDIEKQKDKLEDEQQEREDLTSSANYYNSPSSRSESEQTEKEKLQRRILSTNNNYCPTKCGKEREEKEELQRKLLSTNNNFSPSEKEKDKQQEKKELQRKLLSTNNNYSPTRSSSIGAFWTNADDE